MDGFGEQSVHSIVDELLVGVVIGGPAVARMVCKNLDIFSKGDILIQQGQLGNMRCLYIPKLIIWKLNKLCRIKSIKLNTRTGCDLPHRGKLVYVLIKTKAKPSDSDNDRHIDRH